MHVGRAQFNRVFEHLIDETDDGGFVLRAVVEIVALGIFVENLQPFFFIERADGISTDTEAFLDLALDGFRGGENRFEIEAGECLERVETLRGEQSRGGDFDVAIHALERQQFFFQENARWEKGK